MGFRDVIRSHLLTHVSGPDLIFMVSAAGFEHATHALEEQHGTSSPLSFYNIHAARRHIKRLFGANWPHVGPKFSYEKKLETNRFLGPYGLDIASKPSDIR